MRSEGGGGGDVELDDALYHLDQILIIPKDVGRRDIIFGNSAPA